MILTKQVEIKWARTIIKWYEDKGYIYTNLGDKFIVKIEDLKGFSKVKVNVQCDRCGKILKNRNYSNILKSREKQHKTDDYCNSCARRENIDVVRELFYKNNYTPLFIDSDYITAHSKLNYMCNIHPDKIRYITYTDLYSGKGCKDCGKQKLADLKRIDFCNIINIFKSKNMTLVSNRLDYNTRDSILTYICDIHPEFGIQYTTYNNVRNCSSTCEICIKENSSGKNHPAWNGGITKISYYLREYIKEWKKDSIKNSNYKCIITGQRFDVVHHIYSYNKIIEETFEALNMEIKPLVSNYSLDELEKLKLKVLELHYKHEYGVCITNQIHDLFHSLYGKGNNTPDQWNDFTNKIKAGEIKIA
jgi:hypothetical protein